MTSYCAVTYTMKVIKLCQNVSILFCRIGRRKTQIVCFVIGGAIGVVTAFAVNFWMYMILRFCTAVTLRGFGLANFVLSEFLHFCSSVTFRRFNNRTYHSLHEYSYSQQ